MNRQGPVVDLSSSQGIETPPRTGTKDGDVIDTAVPWAHFRFSTSRELQLPCPSMQ